MTDLHTLPAPPASTEPVKVRLWQRRWVQLTAVAVVALSVGSAAGASGSSSKAAELKAARQKVADLRSSVDRANGEAATLQQQLADANSAVTEARQAANSAVAEAEKKVAGEDAKRRASLKQQKSDLDSRSADLARRERAFQSQVSSYNASAIGEGRYLVGSEIKPGVYHTTGDDGSGDCYWARLSGNNSFDIIDNGNTTGPTTITISSSDHAFDTSGCAEWHKVG
jgi:hypothetical protein